MHVVLAADGARVAQALGHGIDRPQHVAVGLAPARRRAHGAQLHRGEHGAAPGAEVLRRDVAAGELAQVLVDVVGGHRLTLALRAEVLEQLVPRQVLAALDDAREARVGKRDAVLDPALAAEGEAEQLSVDAHMPAAQRGEPVGLVLAHVLVVADADQGLVEQRHHGGEELAPRMVRRTQVALDALAQARQHLAELQHVAELRVIARLAVGGVVAVLLAPAGVSRRSLDVAGGIGTDPHLGPRRRNRQRIEPSSRRCIRNTVSVGLVIGPARADAAPRDAARAVGDVAQPRARRRATVLRQSATRIPALRISCVHLSMSRATSASASLGARRTVR